MHQLGVSLEDLYNGITRKLALQKNVICGKCEGKKKIVVSNPSYCKVFCWFCFCVCFFFKKKSSRVGGWE